MKLENLFWHPAGKYPYRWNPELNQWEFWSYIDSAWKRSLRMAHEKSTAKLYSDQDKVSFTSTWVEPV